MLMAFLTWTHELYNPTTMAIYSELAIALDPQIKKLLLQSVNISRFYCESDSLLFVIIDQIKYLNIK